jgi:hypothetical protein
MVPGTEYGTVNSVLDEYTYSSSQDFDCRLKTANEKFIGDFVMLNIFYIHFCRLREYYNRVVHPSVQLRPSLTGTYQVQYKVVDILASSYR